MALSDHIMQLRKRHAELEEAIKNLMKSPSADMLQIKMLKSQKLRIKDEIEKIQLSA